MSEEEFFVEDILKNVDRKKKLNSGRKGRKAENDLAKLLMARFPGRQFSRVVGSGNRWSQAALSDQAKQVLTGDITCPDSFRFCIESKKGYSDIDLCSVLSKRHPKIDEFLKQASDDAGRVSRQPLVCWKKDRQPTLAILLKSDLGHHVECFEHRMHYAEWTIITLDNLLTLQDEFFFGN